MRPPSRFVAMTSTAENGSLISLPLRGGLGSTEVFAAEGQREDLDHRPGAFRSVHNQIRPAVFPQQLPAPATRHEYPAVKVDAGERHEPTAARRVQRRDQPAFRAETESIGGVLDVASDDDPTVVDQGCGAHRK